MSKKLFGGLLAAVFLIVIGAAVFFLTRTDENVELAEDFFKTSFTPSEETSSLCEELEASPVVIGEGVDQETELASQEICCFLVSISSVQKSRLMKCRN